MNISLLMSFEKYLLLPTYNFQITFKSCKVARVFLFRRYVCENSIRADLNLIKHDCTTWVQYSLINKAKLNIPIYREFFNT